MLFWGDNCFSIFKYIHISSYSPKLINQYILSFSKILLATVCPSSSKSNTLFSIFPFYATDFLGQLPQRFQAIHFFNKILLNLEQYIHNFPKIILVIAYHSSSKIKGLCCSFAFHTIEFLGLLFLYFKTHSYSNAYSYILKHHLEQFSKDHYRYCL